MKRDPDALRDQAAGPTLKRIAADRQRVSKALEPALAVIEERLFDPGLDVNAVWRDSGRPKKTTTLFAAQLGKTPKDYIDDRRIEVAVKLVAGTALKLSRVAETLGYSPVTNTFSKLFSLRTGMAPSAYREAAKDRAAAGEDLSRLLDQVGFEYAAGDLTGALDRTWRTREVLRDEDVRELTERLGFVCHQRGAERTLEGDVDRAYDDLTFARRCYGEAGELSPRISRQRGLLGVADDTDQALLSELCADCRARLLGPEGHVLRQDLRRALRLIPRDLAWFKVSCDDCYRVVWSAISRARAGLMDDAWRAWWLSTHADLADLETPPSRGRIIAALTEVERLVTGDQLQRKAYCDLAVGDAVTLQDSLLEAQARIWRASVLRAMGELSDARAELHDTAEASRASPWLTALHYRMEGVLDSNSNHWTRSAELLRSATAQYRTLDPHVGGLTLIQEAIVHFYLGEYAESVTANQAALSLLDERRDPLPGNGIVPINLASYYALLGDLDKAEWTLSQCRFDRDAHPGLAATEVLHRACLELLHGRAKEAVHLFADIKRRAEGLHRPLDAALASSYSVEAEARLGRRAGAIENAAAALSFFQAAGCTQDTLEAIEKLRALLEAEEIDVMAVTAGVRSLARRHGGWLPEH